MKERASTYSAMGEKIRKDDSVKKQFKEINKKKTETRDFDQNLSSKWYEEIKSYEEVSPGEVNYEEIQRYRTEANSILTEASIVSSSKAPKSLSKSDYAWVKTVMSKGTKTDKIAAHTLIIQDSPVYNLSLLRNMVETVKIGKNKECFMAIDTLRELFLNDLLPPNRKLVSFGQRPLSKLHELTSGNVAARKKLLLLWMFEDQLKSLYGDFVSYLNRIAHDSVEANKEKVITVMCKLLEGNPEREEMLLNNIVNKLGDPSHKVGSKVIYALTKLLEVHPNMREVVVDAVERVIFRTNINKRAQYYSICFLSQFCLFKGDGKIAKKLITIYLSLFKACIKTGDVDSRMMSALLTGVNRAYPYAKEEFELLKEHINTIYKVIHLSHANIAIQALSLVYLVSDYSNAYVDRFYSVLYKKVGEVGMFKCSHHAMFLSLIFRALKKDKERVRICAFIKRLLQICMYVSVPVACGVLIMISELTKNKHDILLKEVVAEANCTIKMDEDSDDGEERYEDVKEENMEQIPSNEITEEVKEEKPAMVQLENIYNVKPVQEMKVWSNPDKSVGDVKEAEIGQYDAFVRNPLYAGADKSFYCELLELSRHFHPTVSLFANKIIEGEHIIYSGDPLLDFTLIRFLDKFSFKNPKTIKPDEEKSVTFTTFGRKKYYSSATIRRLRANTADYLNHSEKNIPVDEVFLYKYMKEKWQKAPRKKGDDNSDVESVGSDEFEEMLSGLADGKRDEINFLSEVGQLPKKSKTAEKEESESEAEFGGDDGDDDDDIGSGEDSVAEDFEGDEVENSDVDLMGSDFDEEELEAELEAGGIKLPKLPKAKKNTERCGRKKKDYKNSLFASAEEFSELLEDTDHNAGGSEALSNRDRAAPKQLKWESERDKWIHKKNFRSKSVKRPHGKTQNKNTRKGAKKRRF